jgi:antitoxin (DNA-binding transcriptional repressor) of toxin-antitoxin stability system
MKTISIKELHAATGKWVRAAKNTTIIVTDHGEQVAELRPIAATTSPKFPKRDWSKMPSSPLDSTDLISADRDGR